MKYLNSHGLPQAYYNAVVRDDYVKYADVSVTALSGSPRQYWLQKRHEAELTEDVVNCVWRLFGKAIHYVLEQNKDENSITEEKIKIDINGWSTGGTPDIFTEEKISDIKTTSCWSIVFDSSKEEYIQQLNAYRYLLMRHGFDKINRIENIFILRDWHKSMVLKNPEMPKHAIEVVDQTNDMWPYDESENYLVSRVKLFQSYEHVPDDQLPMCTEKERWQSLDRYALMKEGRKSAIKVCDSQEEAERLLAEKYKKADHIEFRKGVDKKCQDYCSCAPFCDYYKKVYGNNLNKE